MNNYETPQHGSETDIVEQDREQLVELGTSLTRSSMGNIYTLTIIGQIEGHQVLPPQSKTTKYEHIMPLLATIELDDEIDALLVLLNTVGGDIEAGLGIAELISGMSKPTASLVLGGGHSIGVPLAVSAKRSFIVSSAGMTIHPVRLTGVVIGVQQTYDYFTKIQDRIVEFVVKNSGIDRETFLKLMMDTNELANDVGSVVYGKQAVELGLIDQLGSLSDALEYLQEQIKERRSRAEKIKTEPTLNS